MYLSRLKLNTALRKTILALGNPNIFHGALMNAFPKEDAGRILWRVDRVQGSLYLMIVSQTKPELSVLENQFGYAASPGESKSYDPFLARIEDGSRWYFRIVCNPTVSVLKGKEGISRGKNTPINKTADQIVWLEKAGKTHGFSVETNSVQVLKNEDISFYKGPKGAKRRVVFRSVTMQGYLSVTNADLFREVLCNGLGREKAYGQGMMTIVRPPAA